MVEKYGKHKRQINYCHSVFHFDSTRQHVHRHSSVVSSRMSWTCPPQDSECKQYSVSAQCCTEADELTQVLWEYRCAATRAQDSASSQCSPVPCGHLGFFGVSRNILNASFHLAVWGSQNSFFHWTNEGVGGAALASCKHFGVPLFFYLKVFHSSFEVAITMDQLISSSMEGICEGCLKALASFCPTLLRAQCNMLLVTLMVTVATGPFLWLQRLHTIA